MKFNELLNSFINEQENVESKSLNPTSSQLSTYLSRLINTKEGRLEIVNMLVDIFTEPESNVLASVEEHYRAIRSKVMSLQQRNAPRGRADLIRKQNIPTPQSKQAIPVTRT